uniref:Uncharacterized protein n=1 Tax=Arundo donax TaxID=35708 RepID=A0A0A8YIH7_ARUDO
MVPVCTDIVFLEPLWVQFVVSRQICSFRDMISEI